MCCVQEPLLFYRCAFDGLDWQRSLYSHVATKSLLQSFLDAHLCSASHLVVCPASHQPPRKAAIHKRVMSSKTCADNGHHSLRSHSPMMPLACADCDRYYRQHQKRASYMSGEPGRPHGLACIPRLDIDGLDNKVY